MSRHRYHPRTAASTPTNAKIRNRPCIDHRAELPAALDAPPNTETALASTRPSSTEAPTGISPDAAPETPPLVSIPLLPRPSGRISSHPLPSPRSTLYTAADPHLGWT